MSGAIACDVAKACATITIDHPAKRNSLDLAMLEQLVSVATDLSHRSDLSVVVVQGRGAAAFCAGADFDALRVPPLIGTVSLMDAALQSASAALRAIPVPVVAAIRGACMGGGLELALCADIRIACNSARFSVPAARIGLAYPLPALARMVALGGQGAAALTLLSAQPFSARTARQRGLIEEDLPDDDFDARLQDIIASISACDRASLLAYKAILARLAVGDVSAAQDLHSAFGQQNRFLPYLEQAAARRKTP